jgi:hypothetical protein
VSHTDLLIEGDSAALLAYNVDLPAGCAA